MDTGNSNNRLGDLASLREMLIKIDSMLSVTGDESALNTIHIQRLQAICVPLLRARLAVGNALSELGDTRGGESEPPDQHKRDKG